MLLILINAHVNVQPVKASTTSRHALISSKKYGLMDGSSVNFTNDVANR